MARTHKGVRRTGCIYSELYNDGRHRPGSGLSSVTYRRGIGEIIGKKFRWVGEVTVNGKRHRFRSTNRSNVEFFVRSIIARYGE